MVYHNIIIININIIFLLSFLKLQFGEGKK